MQKQVSEYCGVIPVLFGWFLIVLLVVATERGRYGQVACRRCGVGEEWLRVDYSISENLGC